MHILNDWLPTDFITITITQHNVLSYKVLNIRTVYNINNEACKKNRVGARFNYFNI